MIELKDVSKWYGSFQVLKHCSTNVRKGEVVVVCGPSGSGKSTLIKTVNALEPFQKARSRSTASRSGHEDRPAQVACQDRHGVPELRAVPHMKITENLTIGQIKVLGRRPDEAIERGLKVLDRVACCRKKTNIRASSPAASSSASPSRARCRWTRSPCCSMSRPRHSTRDDQRGARRHGRTGA